MTTPAESARAALRRFIDETSNLVIETPIALQSGSVSADDARPLPPVSEERVVPDARAGVTPSEMVDRKLRALVMGRGFFRASHLRHAAPRWNANS